MKIELIKKDGKKIVLDNVLGCGGDNKNYDIKCEDEEYHFEIKDHKLINTKTKDEYVKMITVDETTF